MAEAGKKMPIGHSLKGNSIQQDADYKEDFILILAISTNYPIRPILTCKNTMYLTSSVHMIVVSKSILPETFVAK